MESYSATIAPKATAWGTSRLARLAACMCFFVAIGGALAELTLAWVWLSPDLVQSLIVPRIGLGTAAATLDGGTRLLGFAMSMVPLGVLFYALHQAYGLFDAYRQENIFNAQAPLRLRRIGLAMIVLAALRPITGAALSVVLTFANPPGQKMLVLGISLDDYMIALFGGLILAIGHVMVEATRISDEHRQIV